MILRIGIYSRPSINVLLNGTYTNQNGETVSGNITITATTLLTPSDRCCRFTLKDVTIGIDFHWQRNEDQTFEGSLETIRDTNGDLIAVNHIDIEDYLKSVISSEMASTSMPELLKAHAVISRSWAARQMRNKSNNATTNGISEKYRRIVWYGNESHRLFDLCADDHCQRYQGIGKATNPNAAAAVEATRGEMLMYDAEICDTRFYKSCGGVTEKFDTCWENRNHPYLTRVEDGAECYFDLTTEEGARAWIESSPASYCNTSNIAILSQVLNDYDQETLHFYRWEVRYSQQELSELIARRSGIDFGDITALTPIKRGVSGRIEEMRIEGTRHSMTVGKELEIRRWLSESCLYSSAFVVDRDDEKGFILHGAGWGHGVGLCQIGAAVMASEGYSYREILAHYYPGSTIEITTL